METVILCVDMDRFIETGVVIWTVTKEKRRGMGRVFGFVTPIVDYKVTRVSQFVMSTRVVDKGSARCQDTAFDVNVMMVSLVTNVSVDPGIGYTETSVLTSMNVMSCSHVPNCAIIRWVHTNVTAEMAS